MIKSPKKKARNITLKIQNSDGSSHLLERRDHVKYLGLVIDHMSYVATRIARNTGVLYKLRYF